MMNHPIALGGVALALFCGLFAAFASSSQAALEATRTYAAKAFVAGGQTGPEMYEPSQIAAEPGTGNLLVANTGNGNVQVYSTEADGNPSYLGNLGEGTVVTPVGIAVDQGTGAIYVSDSGAGEVFRFTSDGAPTPTYALDVSFVSPTLASYASQIAVDSVTHDLLVADTGNQEVRRFDVADGQQIGSFNGSASDGGPFTSLRSVAVSTTGRIYVVDELYPDASETDLDGARVEQFDAGGGYLGQLQGIAQEGAVATDPSSDTTVVSTGNYTGVPLLGLPRNVALFEGANSPLFSANFPVSVQGGVVGLTISGTGPHRLYALTDYSAQNFSGTQGIQTFKPAEIPAAEVGPTSAIGETTAHVTGSVAPGVLSGPGTIRFEYSLDGDTWLSTPDQTGIAGPGETAVSADLAALRPNTVYSVRIHIANEDASADSPVATFTTVATPPAVELSSLSDRTAGSVGLNGKVTPFGQQTVYRFEYGATTAYGSSVPVPAGAAGKGYVPRSVSVNISGLTASTAYHYRLVAENTSGSNATPDATFTTRPASEPTRVYEQVTPVDKKGMVISTSGFYHAADDGNAIGYQGKNGMNLPSTASATKDPKYASLRTADGWSLRQLDVAQGVEAGDATPLFQSTLAISADFSHALVASNIALTPGAVDGTNLYRRNLQTGNLDLVATGLLFTDNKQQAVSRYYGGTRDFSRIIISTQAVLTPDAPPGIFHLYEWTKGQDLQLISRMPNGTPFESSTQDIQAFTPADGLTSSDLSRVYLSAGGGIYLRENGGSSKQISPPGNEGALLGVTPDGRFAAYRTYAGDVYRYDRDTDTTQFIVPTSGDFVYRGLSHNGSSIFWQENFSRTLFVWHEGVTTQIATSDGAPTFDSYGVFPSPNGRYFGFTTAFLKDPPGGYDNSNAGACAKEPNTGVLDAGGFCREVYVYDAQEQALICASCPADGSRSTGYVHMGAKTPELSRHHQPFVNDKGQVFFDTPTSLVAADSNGRRDVYEYQDGEVRLISPGSGDFEAALADASADGDDVFFATDQGLVGQDIDGELDLYDARIGGGFASQGGPATAGTCAGSDCRGPAPPPVILPPAASEAIDGRFQSPRPRPHKKKHKKKAQHKKSKAKAKAQQRGQRPASNRNFGK
jgi:hypothetical protein